MSYKDYEQAANDMRVWLEDNRKAKMESLDDLEEVLGTVLAKRRMSYGVAEDLAWDTAMDDAIAITAIADALRPVLEAWWRDE